MHRPAPIRAVATVAPLRTDFTLQHPTPGLESLQGAHLSNIERLEETAERLSLGSDIGEEIRKVWQEQKRRDRRTSSTGPSLSNCKSFGVDLARQTSASSHTHSIIDVNSTARWGGYSPNGYVTSPIGSVDKRSMTEDSRSRGSARVRRSGSGMSDFRAPSERDQERQLHNSTFGFSSTPPRTGPSGTFLSNLQERSGSHAGSRVSTSSRSDRQGNTYVRPTSAQHVPLRSTSKSSTATSTKAWSLFRDFEGVHNTALSDQAANDYVTEMDRTNIEEEVQGNDHGVNMSFDAPAEVPEVSIKSVTIQQSQVVQWTEPPPSDGMVYYPAPVPKTLNLPKRLSKHPIPALQPQRQSQFYGSLPAEIRKSEIWLPRSHEDGPTKDSTPQTLSPGRDHVKQRQSQINMQGLPPQLRASVFFDQPTVTQQVQVKHGSAMATLDSLLDASAQAPVIGALNGRAGNGSGLGALVNGNARSSTISLLPDTVAEARKSRISLFSSKSCSTDLLAQENAKITSPLVDLCMMTLHDEQQPRSNENSETADWMETVWTDIEAESVKSHSQDQASTSDPSEDHPTAPTTLLAELQHRKDHQRSRNRTAASAFPNGMHATLLELDAVAQVERKRRQSHRPALAWEDPTLSRTLEGLNQPYGTRADDEDDVPLALLFPSRIHKRNLSDWDRPLGLLGQRELEDSEPLSQRRNRLRRGGEANADTSAGAEESLAQRTRRLKAAATTRPVADEFAAEVLAGLRSTTGAVGRSSPVAAGVGDEEGETLAQRRRRLLQVEAAAALAAAASPPLPPAHSALPPQQSQSSPAGLLAAYPVASLKTVGPVEEADRRVVGMGMMGRGESLWKLDGEGLQGFRGGVYNDGAGGGGGVVDAKAEQQRRARTMGMGGEGLGLGFASGTGAGAWQGRGEREKIESWRRSVAG